MRPVRHREKEGTAGRYPETARKPAPVEKSRSPEMWGSDSVLTEVLIIIVMIAAFRLYADSDLAFGNKNQTKLETEACLQHKPN